MRARYEPPLLLGCEYIAAMARHSLAFRRPLLAQERAPPSFWGDLTPAQRALMGADDNSSSLDFPSREGGSWGRAFRHPLRVPSL